MKSNKICSKLRKGANFAAANLPLRPQKTTMTGQGGGGLEQGMEEEVWNRTKRRRSGTGQGEGLEQDKYGDWGWRMSRFGTGVGEGWGLRKM